MTRWKSEMIYEEYDISLSTSHAISVDMLALPCLPSSKRPAPPLAELNAVQCVACWRYIFIETYLHGDAYQIPNSST